MIEPYDIDARQFEQLLQSASALADYYEKSLNVGPGPNPAREALLWGALRIAITTCKGDKCSTPKIS